MRLIRPHKRGNSPVSSASAGLATQTQIDAARVVSDLSEMIGDKFTAYVASVDDGLILKQWSQRITKPSACILDRMRIALKVCSPIYEATDRETVQAWLRGKNPDLGDRVVLVMLREEQDLIQLEHDLKDAAEIFAEK